MAIHKTGIRTAADEKRFLEFVQDWLGNHPGIRAQLTSQHPDLYVAGHINPERIHSIDSFAEDIGKISGIGEKELDSLYQDWEVFRTTPESEPVTEGANDHKSGGETTHKNTSHQQQHYAYEAPEVEEVATQKQVIPQETASEENISVSPSPIQNTVGSDVQTQQSSNTPPPSLPTQRPNMIKNLSNIRKRGNNAKNLFKEANFARTGIQAAAAANPELWPFILAGIGIVLGLLLVFSMFIMIIVSALNIFGGSSSDSNTPTNTTIGTNHQAPPYMPQGKDALRAALNEKFGIDFDASFSEDELTWAWRKLWDVSGTQFPNLIKGKVNFTGPKLDGGSYWSVITCGNMHCHIYFNHYQDEGIFDIIFTHELSHAINGTNDVDVSHYNELFNTIIADGAINGGDYRRLLGTDSIGGYVTHYSANAGTGSCGGGSPLAEDYAEMITYYLNPQASEHTLCASGQPNPYANGGHPNHLNLARKIIGNY